MNKSIHIFSTCLRPLHFHLRWLFHFLSVPAPQHSGQRQNPCAMFSFYRSKKDMVVRWTLLVFATLDSLGEVNEDETRDTSPCNMLHDRHRDM